MSGATTPTPGLRPARVKSPVLSGDELGWRLAGLVDGEGCFHITNSLGCVFVVGMRDDDRPFLELMQRSTGLGRINQVNPTALALSRRPGTKPQVHWRIGNYADARALVAILDQYPPLSKKARDYAIWREAVLTGSRERAEELRVALMAGRAYGFSRAREQEKNTRGRPL